MTISQFWNENYPILILFICGTGLVWLISWGMTREKKEDKDDYKGEW